MPDQLHDKTECFHVCDDFRDEVEIECWELSHLRPSLHLHVMKMIACVVQCRISLIIFLYWICFDEYFLRWQKYLMHKSKIFSIALFSETTWRYTSQNSPTNGKQTANSVPQTWEQNTSCNILDPCPQRLPLRSPKRHGQAVAAVLMYSESRLATSQRQNCTDADVDLWCQISSLQ